MPRSKLWRSSEEGRAQARAYYARPEVKARRKAYFERPEVKARLKAYQARPEVRAKQRESWHRPEVKAKRNAYLAGPDIRARRAAYERKYRQKPAWKVWAKERYKKQRDERQRQEGSKRSYQLPEIEALYQYQRAVTLETRRWILCDLECYYSETVDWAFPWRWGGPTRRQDLTDLVNGRESIFVSSKSIPELDWRFVPFDPKWYADLNFKRHDVELSYEDLTDIRRAIRDLKAGKYYDGRVVKKAMKPRRSVARPPSFPVLNDIYQASCDLKAGRYDDGRVVQELKRKSPRPRPPIANFSVQREVLTRQEAADFCRISLRMFDALIAERRLPIISIGGSIRGRRLFLRSSLLEFLAGAERKPTERINQSEET